MKSSIVFYDSYRNSKRGTFRGMVIFIPIIILNFLFFKYYYVKQDTFKFYVALIISSLLIVSSIGIHNPDSVKKAIVYSALVGFVIYGVMSIFMYGLKHIGLIKCFITIVWGIFTTGLMGYLLYIIVQKYPNTFSYN
jgi:phosphatidylserine synthase